MTGLPRIPELLCHAEKIHTAMSKLRAQALIHYILQKQQQGIRNGELSAREWGKCHKWKSKWNTHASTEKRKCKFQKEFCSKNQSLGMIRGHLRFLRITLWGHVSTTQLSGLWVWLKMSKRERHLNLQYPKEKRNRKKWEGGRELQNMVHSTPGITPVINSLIVSSIIING